MATPNLNDPTVVITPGVLYSGQVSGTAETTVLQAASGTGIKVATMTVANVSGGAVTVTISVVKSGGTAGATFRVVNAFSVAASDDFSVDEIKGLFLGDGDFISVKASAGAALDVVISGITFS